MKTITMNVVALILGIHINAFAHEMQHGFILTDNDTFASHLVASGHHSRQVEMIGRLVIPEANEAAFYQQRKEKSTVIPSYFLLQAQQLDLPSLTAGKILTGHIIESKIGDYEPKNVVVKSASFEVQKVLLNIENPFFVDEFLSIQPKRSPLQDGSKSDELLNSLINEKKHCCETGKKPCNWKC